MREGRIDVQSQVNWRGQLGLWRAYRQGNRIKYDLVHRDSNGVIDHLFFGVSDWGLGEGWQALLGERLEESVEQEPGAFHEDEQQPAPELESPEAPEPASGQWGERRYRWRGRGGIWRISYDADGGPLFDLAMKDQDGQETREFAEVTREKLTDAWLGLIRVPRPRTGIEVVRVVEEEGEQRFVFCNLRTGEVSNVPWRLQDIEEGTVRQYAARMTMKDNALDEDQVRWWGNIGYMRPMRSQVDLIYRDENGLDHIYYAARRDELTGPWRALLDEYAEV